MTGKRVEKGGLQVDAALAEFLERDVLAPLGRDLASFWSGFADLARRFAPRNLALLDARDALQAKIDHWHAERRQNLLFQERRQRRVDRQPAFLDLLVSHWPLLTRFP